MKKIIIVSILIIGVVIVSIFGTKVTKQVNMNNEFKTKSDEALEKVKNLNEEILKKQAALETEQTSDNSYVMNVQGAKECKSDDAETGAVLTPVLYEGNLDAIVITEIKEGSVWEKALLKNGDEIVAIDQININSLKPSWESAIKSKICGQSDIVIRRLSN